MQANDGPLRVAVVAAADQDMRILLRGLLQLHHVRVEAETDGATEAVRLLRKHRPALVVADVRLREGSASELVTAARSLLPHARVVLLVPANQSLDGLAERTEVDVVLQRPFRICEFADAIGRAAPRKPPS